MSENTKTTPRQPDTRILKLIQKNHRDVIKYPEWCNLGIVHRVTGLSELEALRGLDRSDVWAALSRLVVAKKIKCTGSNRYKTYAPTEEA